MKIYIYLFAAALPLLSSSCLMRRIITENGSVIESKYVMKRPLKSQ
jgi:hypothetical protein